MVKLDAEEYIARFGGALSEADKSYIRAFGAPDIPDPGPSRGGLSQETPDIIQGVYQGTVDEDERIARAEAGDERMRLIAEGFAEISERERQDAFDEEEAAEWDEL